MKHVLPSVALFLLSGCDSSGSTTGGPPVFGGFQPISGSAVIYTPTPCTIAGLGDAAVAGILLDFAGYDDSCGVLTKINLCGNKASSTRIMALVLSGQPGATTVDPAGPGTYSFTASPPTAAFKAATAKAVQDDASCELLPNASLDMTKGTITIAGVSDAQVSGATDIHFENGTSFQYSFDFPVCTKASNLCAHLQGIGCDTYACAP